MKSRISLSALAAALALIFSAGRAPADFQLDFNPTNTFSGTAPSGSLTAAFSDVSGGVQLVITSSLASGENIDPGKAFYFNYDQSNLSKLVFTLTANTGFSQQASVSTGSNSFKADGEKGEFDILLTYTPSTKAFTTGESQTYLITTSDSSAISAASFDVGAETYSHYLAAIHVQNTPSGGSGSAWVSGTLDNGNGKNGGTTPAPSSAILLSLGGLGLLGFAGLRRWRKAVAAA